MFRCTSSSGPCAYSSLTGRRPARAKAQTYAHIPSESFINSARFALPFSDVVRGLLKSLVFAVFDNWDSSTTPTVTTGRRACTRNCDAAGSG